jgi:hypothetical protein
MAFSENGWELGSLNLMRNRIRILEEEYVLAKLYVNEQMEMRLLGSVELL